ncbi:30S ribosomal protein S6 [SAR202 cluster bacterium AD-802-E10_MRT_200m]|nr:30S ribosomal protein S6 [SAR202 cluster bacterium AD-802-E10_MRT_200m]
MTSFASLVTCLKSISNSIREIQLGRTRDYEIVLILTPAIDDERSSSIVDRIDKFITDQGGEISKEESWGMRRLAYPIQRFNEGNYYLRKFSLDGDHIKDMEAYIGVSEEILRHMIVKLDTK